MALFALLGYAVTQSGRGGGNATKEQAILDSAAIIGRVDACRERIEKMQVGVEPAGPIEFPKVRIDA
ncbi:MAG: hypothetical protein AABX97_07380 [Candidatus Thermoplasmatota archaeon]